MIIRETKPDVFKFNGKTATGVIGLGGTFAWV